MKPDLILPTRIPLDAFQRFVENLQDYAVSFLDKEGRVCSWNAGARRIQGFAAAEVIGKPYSMFYAAADVANRRHLYELRVATAEGRYEEEGWRLRRDGSMFWANVTIHAIKDPDGTLLGFASVTRDLTSRKHSEEALRQSEERYRILIESVRDYAIFILDTEGRIMTWNEGARRMKGYEADDIIGEHFSKFYRSDDIERKHPQHELEVALKEGRYVEEGWRVRKDGTEFLALVTITTLRDPGGKHIGFAKVTRDLSTREASQRPPDAA